MEVSLNQTHRSAETGLGLNARITFLYMRLAVHELAERAESFWPTLSMMCNNKIHLMIHYFAVVFQSSVRPFLAPPMFIKLKID
mmetsp:Transcript_68470/g.121154  ORF Transcript_68470/g.121154 Transcript_68470/m.121154 type:complete len:84 (-) Transcript_68470:3312-3563(-)